MLHKIVGPFKNELVQLQGFIPLESILILQGHIYLAKSAWEIILLRATADTGSWKIILQTDNFAVG